MNPRRAPILVVCWAVAIASAAGAFETGISGRSGKQRETCTDGSCHSSGSVPTVRLEGPSNVLPNSTSAFRLALESHGARQIAGGLNVAVDGGILFPIENGTRLETDEITHVAPRLTVDINRDGAASVADVIAWLRLPADSTPKLCQSGDLDGDTLVDAEDEKRVVAAPFDASSLFWQFDWQAPATPGAYKIFAAALSANCNGTRSGDNAAHVSHTINVLAP